MKNRTFFLLFLSAVLVRLIFHFITDFTADGALITFRYAENLIAGHGLVYNTGEKVLGTSTPLFTFLISILLLIKATPLSASLLISVICSGLTAVVIYRFAEHLRFTRFAIVPAVVYVLWPRSIVADSSGLETSLFTLLIIGAFYFQHRRLLVYSIALATLSAVTRPEGFLLLAILLIYNAIYDYKNLPSYLFVPSVIILPWLAFSYSYFGSLVPASITGKLALYSQIEIPSYWEKFVYLLGWHNPLGWIMSAAAIVGGWWLVQKQNFGKLEIVWLSGMLLFFTLSKTQLFFWYVVPIYPVYILFAAAALPMIADRLSLQPARLRIVAKVLTILFILPLSYMTYKQIKFYDFNARYLSEVHRAIGLYLKSNAGPRDLVAARYIGNTGYFSGLKILDRDGIVTPSANDYNRNGDYLGFILDNNPEWVVAAPTRVTGRFAQSEKFLEKYELVNSYGWDDTVRHNLYRKKSIPL